MSTIAIIGTIPCHTPACGWKKGMETPGPANIVRMGSCVRVWCERCGGCWGMSKEGLKEALTFKRPGRAGSP